MAPIFRWCRMWRRFAGCFACSQSNCIRGLKLYVSPINVDPDSPALPISTPASYARDVRADIGEFTTLGIGEDTSALRQGVFDLPEFLVQSRLVLE